MLHVDKANAYLQGLLHHTLFKEADELDGQWKRAFDQIANQVCLTSFWLYDDAAMSALSHQAQLSKLLTAMHAAEL